MPAIADQRRATVGGLTADHRRRMADHMVVPRRLTMVVLMRARRRRMVEATRVRLLPPMEVVWVVGRRLTAAAGLMVRLEVVARRLTAVDRQVGSAVVDMPLADSAGVGTLQAVEDIAAAAEATATEVAEATAAVATVAVTKT